MGSFLGAIFPCFGIRNREGGIRLPTGNTITQQFSEKEPFPFHPCDGKTPKLSSDEAASSIVSAMLDADKIDSSLGTTIQSLVHQTGGWSEYLAEKILAGLEAVLKAGKGINGAMQVADDKACEAAKVFEEFAADHPYAVAAFCTVIALGVLVVLAPYALEALGFGELGPIEGEIHFQNMSASQMEY